MPIPPFPTSGSQRFDVDSQSLRAKKARIEQFFDGREYSAPDSDRLLDEYRDYISLLYQDSLDPQTASLFLAGGAADPAYWGADSDWLAKQGAAVDINVIDRGSKNIRSVQTLVDLLAPRTNEIVVPGGSSATPFRRRIPQNVVTVNDSDSTTRIVNINTLLKANLPNFLNMDPVVRNNITYNIIQAIQDDSDVAKGVVSNVFNTVRTTDSEFNNAWDALLDRLTLDRENYDATGSIPYRNPPLGDSDAQSILNYNLRGQISRIVADGIFYDSDYRSGSSTGQNYLAGRLWESLIHYLKRNQRDRSISSHRNYFDNVFYDYFNRDYAFQDEFLIRSYDDDGQLVPSDSAVNVSAGTNGVLSAEEIDRRRVEFLDFVGAIAANEDFTPASTDVTDYHKANARFVRGLISEFMDSESTADDQNRGWLTRRLAEAIGNEPYDQRDSEGNTDWVFDSDRNLFIENSFWRWWGHDSDNRSNRIWSWLLDQVKNNDDTNQLVMDRIFYDHFQGDNPATDSDSEIRVNRLWRLLVDELDQNDSTHNWVFDRFFYNFFAHDSENRTDRIIGLLRDEFDNDSEQRELWNDQVLLNWLLDDSENCRRLWNICYNGTVANDSDEMADLWNNLLDRIDPEHADRQELQSDRFREVFYRQFDDDSEWMEDVNLRLIENLYDANAGVNYRVRDGLNVALRYVNGATELNRHTFLRTILVAMAGVDSVVDPSTGRRQMFVDSDAGDVFGDWLAGDSDGGVGTPEIITDARDLSYHLLWRMFLNAYNRLDNNDRNDRANALNDTADIIVGRIHNDSDDQVVLNESLRNSTRDITQTGFVLDGGDIEPAESMVTFVTPSGWAAPNEEYEVSVFLNGILQTKDEDLSLDGTTSLGTGQDVQITYVKRSTGSDDIVLTFENPLLVNYVVTIKYTAVRKSEGFIRDFNANQLRGIS